MPWETPAHTTVSVLVALYGAYLLASQMKCYKLGPLVPRLGDRWEGTRYVLTIARYPRCSGHLPSRAALLRSRSADPILRVAPRGVNTPVRT